MRRTLVNKCGHCCYSVYRVYSSIPAEDSLDFDMVKAFMLGAYELVPEAYRRRFRMLRKPGYQTFVGFAHAKDSF